MILGPDGKPIVVTERVIGEQPIRPPGPSRQMRRAYLRLCAISVINQKAGLEPRKLRRSMALTLAKRPAFVEEIRNATKAW